VVAKCGLATRAARVDCRKTVFPPPRLTTRVRYPGTVISWSRPTGPPAPRARAARSPLSKCMPPRRRDIAASAALSENVRHDSVTCLEGVIPRLDGGTAQHPCFEGGQGGGLLHRPDFRRRPRQSRVSDDATAADRGPATPATQNHGNASASPQGHLILPRGPIRPAWSPGCPGDPHGFEQDTRERIGFGLTTPPVDGSRVTRGYCTGFRNRWTARLPTFRPCLMPSSTACRK